MYRFCIAAGRAVHKPGKRGVRLHAGPRAGRRACGHGTGTASRGAHVLVLGVLVHGQRDIVSAETVPGRGQPGRFLGPVPGHRPRHVGQDVAHQRRARVLHGDLQRAQGLRHAQRGVADGVMSAPMPPPHSPVTTAKHVQHKPRRRRRRSQQQL